MVQDELKKAKLKEEIRDAASDMVRTIKYLKALFEAEEPGYSNLLIDVMCSELEKLRTPVPEVIAARKAMLSQPMAGKTDEEIRQARERAMAALQEKGFTVINTLFTDEWYSQENMARRGVVQIPLCFLAKSLENMSLCHAAYFCKGWENARGCRIEHEAAKAYGLEIIYEEEHK